jgi:HEAT repeat protein
MPNRLSLAKRESKAEEKVRKAEAHFKELAEAKQRKIERKAQKLADKKAMVAGEVDDAWVDVNPTAEESEWLAQQSADLDEELHWNASVGGVPIDRNANAEAVPIDLRVHCMTGEEFWLTPLLDTSVADLKSMLSEVWGILPACQQLLMDCTMLRDSDLLSHHVQDRENVAECTALVVIGELRNAGILAKLALRGGEGILDAVFNALGSDDDGMRYQMFTEVRNLATQGDARAITILIEFLNHAAEPSMREEILHSLARVGAQCDPARVAIISQLQQPEACVRIAALQACPHFAANTFEKTIHGVFECLEDELEDVRFQAVQTLAVIASQGHADDIAREVQKRFVHAHGGVRRAAVQALSHIIAQVHDQSGCTETVFLPLLKDCDADVRAAAVQAIDCIVAWHSQQAFEAMISTLFDSDWCVRQLTLRALGRFAHKDPDFLILSAKPYLRHKDAMIRCTAVEALRTVKESWLDEDITSDLEHLLSDNDVLVRSVAAEVLKDIEK